MHLYQTVLVQSDYENQHRKVVYCKITINRTSTKLFKYGKNRSNVKQLIHAKFLQLEVCEFEHKPDKYFIGSSCQWQYIEYVLVKYLGQGLSQRKNSQYRFFVNLKKANNARINVVIDGAVKIYQILIPHLHLLYNNQIKSIQTKYYNKNNVLSSVIILDGRFSFQLRLQTIFQSKIRNTLGATFFSTQIKRRASLIIVQLVVCLCSQDNSVFTLDAILMIISFELGKTALYITVIHISFVIQKQKNGSGSFSAQNQHSCTCGECTDQLFVQKVFVDTST
ncbi:Hypothetical_protein [Hexamita inflata]|uniref:Hypothetical_protein n=1 Tax=Hexamita inflata TaxID=28002 RepID=A0AA86NQI2_9EUKA|nr:Hypothetical protein HINF_LOCUS11623 [Hexamita inflata]